MPKPPWDRVVVLFGLAEVIEDVRQETGRNPLAVSATCSTSCEPVCSIRTLICPRLGANLMALLNRFQATCCKRSESPHSIRREPEIDIQRQLLGFGLAGRIMSMAA